MFLYYIFVIVPYVSDFCFFSGGNVKGEVGFGGGWDHLKVYFLGVLQAREDPRYGLHSVWHIQWYYDWWEMGMNESTPKSHQDSLVSPNKYNLQDYYWICSISGLSPSRIPIAFVWSAERSDLSHLKNTGWKIKHSNIMRFLNNLNKLYYAQVNVFIFLAF